MKSPLIIWNHRWEYDKNPEVFFKLLIDLSNNHIDFEVAILGERFKKYPKIFDEAKQILGNKIVQFGYLDSHKEYAQWLEKGDLIPITSNQDFFGESLIQAMYHNCYPLVPNRLVFPEHFPAGSQSEFMYNSYEELFMKSKYVLTNNGDATKVDVRQFVVKYDWKNIVTEYDFTFESILKT